MIEQFHKKKLKQKSNKYLYIHVHRNIIHNSQKSEQPKCPLMYKWLKISVYTCNEILVSLKKEENFS